MKLWLWLGIVLEASPLAAFCLLTALQPTGDPQNSSLALVRYLDFLGTYGIRNAVPLPPPLLVIGILLCAWVWRQQGSGLARISTLAGLLLLGLWGLMMAALLLIHVN